MKKLQSSIHQATQNSIIGGSGWQTPPAQSGLTIAERDLLLYIRSRVLRRLTIIETASGLYRLHVTLAVEPLEVELSSVRGQPREWSSLDSLAKQIRVKYGSPACVMLALRAAVPKPGILLVDVERSIP